MDARWCLGPTPKSLDDATIELVKQLFLDQTGERYAGASVKSLPIPEWGGNLVLLDANNMVSVVSEQAGVSLLVCCKSF